MNDIIETNLPYAIELETAAEMRVFEKDATAGWLGSVAGVGLPMLPDPERVEFLPVGQEGEYLRG